MGAEEKTHLGDAFHPDVYALALEKYSFLDQTHMCAAEA